MISADENIFLCRLAKVFSLLKKNCLHFDRDRLHFHIHNLTEVIMPDLKSCPSHGRVGR